MADQDNGIEVVEVVERLPEDKPEKSEDQLKKDRSVDNLSFDVMVDDAIDRAIIGSKLLAERINQIDDTKVENTKAAIKENMRNIGYGAVGIVNSLKDLVTRRK